jgi:hypothetical protein
VSWFQDARRVLHSNARWPVVTDGVTMHLDVILDILLTPVPQPLANRGLLSRHREWSKKIRQASVSVCQAIRLVCIGPRRWVYGAKLDRPNGERVDRCTSSLQTSATGHRKWRSSLRLRQWSLGIDGPRMPSCSIRRDLSLDDTLQVLRGSSMMAVG